MMDVTSQQPHSKQSACSKILPHHFNRLAIIYIRQSTLQQVEKHQESTKLQYALKDKALNLGWAKAHVEIIDEDLGRSGTNAEGRPGFQRLVTEVSLEHVGIIIGIEISRLARSCRDWHQLLEVCALFRTLIADTDGIYDPSNYNDRLLLGLKGTMSEAELHIIKQRMLAGKKAKAKRGELGLQLAIGYVKHPSGNTIKDPDEQAQSTIEMIFKLFDKYRTINAVLKHLVKHDILLPHRIRSGLNKGDLSWRRPNRVTLSNLLHNPIYAGAYAYGRRPTDPRRKKPGRPSTGRIVAKRSEWEVLLKDKLPTYISWEDYERNQKQLLMNSSKGIGVAKHGSALLSGIILCGRCGLRMSAIYGSDGSKFRYACNRMLSDYGEASCQSFLGNPLDQVIEEKIFAAMEPSALEVSLQVAQDLEEEKKQIHMNWQRKLERSRYETERAYRQYNLVEPENRLVLRMLEKKWEEALSAEASLKQEYENYISAQPIALTSDDGDKIRSIAKNIPTLWHAATTTQEQRKNILRLLIARVIAKVDGDTENVYVEIHWVGGHKTQTKFERPVGKLVQLSYYKELSERVTALYYDGKQLSEIAEILNEEGWQTAKKKNTFTSNTIRSLLLKNSVKSRKKSRSDLVNKAADEYSIRELSEKLDIPEPTLYRWLQVGKIHGRHDVSVSHQGVWLIKADKNEINRIINLRKQPKQWVYKNLIEKVD